MSSSTFTEVQKTLTKLLETEGADWTKSWISAQRPINFVSRKPYRGLNYFWLAVQGRTSHEWATWKQWTEAGYTVKKEERKNYSHIFFSQQKPKKEEWLEGKELARYQATGELPNYWLWKRWCVYSADQIEGYTPEPIAHTTKTELSAEETADIDRWFDATGADFQHGGYEAFYSPATDTITMPQKEHFFSDVDYYSTKGHETIHWTGNKKRLDRLMVGDRAKYALEELVAEIGSAMLCHELGIEKTVRADHAKYINGWLEAVKDSEKAMIYAFSKAQKAMDYLMERTKSAIDAGDEAA